MILQQNTTRTTYLIIALITLLCASTALGAANTVIRIDNGFAENPLSGAEEGTPTPATSFSSILIAATTGSTSNWVERVLKFDWSNSLENSFFCNDNTECLVDKEDEKTPNCDANGLFDGDRYCKNGDWASRTTVFLAPALYDIATSNSPNSYQLVCSKPESILNDIDLHQDFINGQCGPAGNQQDCITNACVLQYGDNTAFGVSLNNNDALREFLEAIGEDEDACSSITGNSYSACGNTGAYYNHATKTIIVSPEHAVGSFSDTDLVADYEQLVNSRVARTTAYAQQLTDSQETLNKDYFTRPQHHEHFALIKEGSLSMYSHKEESQTSEDYDYVIITYTNTDFTTRDCDGLFKNERNVHRGTTEVYCNEQTSNTSYHVIGQSTGEEGSISTIWTDLVAKVRP